jgi:hypothetical protein
VDKVLEERITKGEKIMLSDGKFIERMLTIKQINSGNASKAPFYRHLVPLNQNMTFSFIEISDKKNPKN